MYHPPKLNNTHSHRFQQQQNAYLHTLLVPMYNYIHTCTYIYTQLVFTHQFCSVKYGIYAFMMSIFIAHDSIDLNALGGGGGGDVRKSDNNKEKEFSNSEKNICTPPHLPKIAFKAVPVLVPFSIIFLFTHTPESSLTSNPNCVSPGCKATEVHEYPLCELNRLSVHSAFRPTTLPASTPCWHFQLWQK